jgi:chaperone required for assembly of F1-ATPase
MLNKTMKRFYKRAAAAAIGDGFAVHLDGRAVKTPAGKPLAVPFQRLAEAMAAEWQDQGDDIIPASMPLTQLASTALDRIGPERAVIMEQLAHYAGTDLLCYRADSPTGLVERQSRNWQPLLDWAEREMGACLQTTTSLIAIAQPADALAALNARLESYDVWRLTVTQATCAACGSLVLGMALAEGHIDAAQAFELSQLDETYQIEQWGEDWEATQRRDALKRDLMAAETLRNLI